MNPLADAYLQRAARVVELEAKLAEREPYRSFVEQVRQRVQRKVRSTYPQRSALRRSLSILKGDQTIAIHHDFEKERAYGRSKVV